MQKSLSQLEEFFNKLQTKLSELLNPKNQDSDKLLEDLLNGIVEGLKGTIEIIENPSTRVPIKVSIQELAPVINKYIDLYKSMVSVVISIETTAHKFEPLEKKFKHDISASAMYHYLSMKTHFLAFSKKLKLD